MPDIEGGEYLVEILYDVGPVSSSGFGATAISELELLAWQINRGVWLEPWECEMIRDMSRAYASMMTEAGSTTCPPPFGGSSIDTEARKRVAAAFESLSDTKRG